MSRIDNKVINILETLASFYGFGELFRTDGQLNSGKVHSLINRAIGDSKSRAMNYLNELRNILNTYDTTIISPNLKSILNKGRDKISQRIKSVEETINSADRAEQDAINNAAQVDLQATNSAKWDVEGSTGHKLKTEAVDKAASAADLYESALKI